MSNFVIVIFVLNFFFTFWMFLRWSTNGLLNSTVKIFLFLLAATNICIASINRWDVISSLVQQ